MSIRITTIPDSETTVIKIDGRLTQDDTGELVRIFRTVEGRAALDLTELQSVDRTSVVLLRDSIAAGMELRAASRYLELLLKWGTTL